MTFKIKRKYYIMEEVDGKLGHPKERWSYYNECLFNEYGYDSQEEAEQELLNHHNKKIKESNTKYLYRSDDYVLITKIQAVPEEESDA